MSRSGYAARIRVRILELKKIIEAAQSELKDLEVAQRVLDRLGDNAEPSYMLPQDVDTKLNETSKHRTIADVAIETLSEHGPKSSSALLEIMQQQWRPDLALTTLTSTLSRIGKDGSVKHVNGLWQLPDRNSEDVTDEY